VKVNVDRRPAVANALQVQGIPTIMLFWRGEARMRLTGAYPYERIRSSIEENWPRESSMPTGGAGAVT
jgi:thioredoxin 1